MKKIIYLLFILVLVTTFSLTNTKINYVAHAEGTVPCSSDKNSSDKSGIIPICVAQVDIPNLPGGAVGWIVEVTEPELILPLPKYEHPIGSGANVYILDEFGNPINWINPPAKICFPVAPATEAIIRRWVTPAELSTWYPGQTFTQGVWVPIPTTYENGMTCGSSFLLPGPFAVFVANH
jgi:hypothetical protein